MSQRLESTFIISQLANLLRQEPLPKELEITILPFPEEGEAEDASSFLKDGVHLGIHAPHVPSLACEIRKAYYQYRSNVRGEFNHDESWSHEDIRGFMDCVSCMLLLCPDHATAWADRRRLLLQQLQSTVVISRSNKGSNDIDALIFWNDEIRYLNMLFTQHSKAPNAWAHRKWICRQVLKLLLLVKENDGDASNEDISEFLPYRRLLKWCTLEIALCSVVAEKYPKNYYAWTHRIFIVRTIVYEFDNISNGDCREEICSFLHSEIQFITSWLHHHVSDHSAAHYGGEILALMIPLERNVCRRIEVMDEILDSSKQLLEKFPCHEVIWIWRRICFRLLLKYFDAMKSDDVASVPSMEMVVKNEVLLAQTFFKKSESVPIVNLDELQSQKYFSLVYNLWILNYAFKHMNRKNLKQMFMDHDESVIETVKNQIHQYEQCPSDCEKYPLVPPFLVDMIYDLTT